MYNSNKSDHICRSNTPKVKYMYHVKFRNARLKKLDVRCAVYILCMETNIGVCSMKVLLVIP